MGESDTRRSSRARTAQSQPQAPSSSSSTSGRAERSSRSSTNKTSSPQLTTPAPSTSASEPPDDASVNGTETVVRTLRSRARDGNNSDRDRAAAASADSADMASSENEMQDDDESVRCICGFDEYPGPPVLKDDTKNPSKDAADIDPFLAADVPDEVAGFFLQCDVCKVWQHGGCVGILNAASSPDEYFCEECRKDLHKISTASNGYVSSQLVSLCHPIVSGTGCPKWPLRRSMVRITRLVASTNKSPTAMFLHIMLLSRRYHTIQGNSECLLTSL